MIFKRQRRAWVFATVNLGIAALVAILATAVMGVSVDLVVFSFSTLPGGILGVFLSGVSDSSWHFLVEPVLGAVMVLCRLALLAPFLLPPYPGSGWLWTWTIVNTGVTVLNGISALVRQV